MGSLMLGGAILVAAFLLFTAAAGRRGVRQPRRERHAAPHRRLAPHRRRRLHPALVQRGRDRRGPGRASATRSARWTRGRSCRACGSSRPGPTSSGSRPARSSSPSEQRARRSRSARSPASRWACRWTWRCAGRSIRCRRPHIFRELGAQEQIQNVVLNAIRNGVRDGMVQYSINDIAQRNRIAGTMSAEVDSALVTAAANGRRAVPDRRGDRLLPARPPAAAAGGPGDQQQDRPGAADRDRAPPGRGRAAPGRAAAAAQPDAHGGGADQAVPRGAARPAHVEQRGADRADRRGDAGAGHGGAAEESDAKQRRRARCHPERSEGGIPAWPPSLRSG